MLNSGFFQLYALGVLGGILAFLISMLLQELKVDLLLSKLFLALDRSQGINQNIFDLIDIPTAVQRAIQEGSICEISYLDASGAFHVRTVEFYRLDNPDVVRTRCVEGKMFRQVIIKNIQSIRWVVAWSPSVQKAQVLKYHQPATA